MTARTASLPIGPRARSAVVALWSNMAVQLFYLFSTVVELVAVTRGLAVEAEVNDGLLVASDVLSVASVLASLGALLVAAVFFLMWFHRGHRILHAALPDDPPRGTKWAVISWFVPFVNFFVPKMAANDLWRAGTADRVPGLVHWWWGLWVLSTLLDGVVGRLFAGAETLEDLRVTYIVDLFATGLNIGVAILAIRVVRVITGRLGRLAAPSASAVAPTPPTVTG